MADVSDVRTIVERHASRSYSRYTSTMTISVGLAREPGRAADERSQQVLRWNLFFVFDTPTDSADGRFDVVETTIPQIQAALDAGRLTCRQLVAALPAAHPRVRPRTPRI